MSQEPYKLKVVRLESGEIEIIGNRTGLKDLADAQSSCTVGQPLHDSLSDLTTLGFSQVLSQEEAMPGVTRYWKSFVKTCNQDQCGALLVPVKNGRNDTARKTVFTKSTRHQPAFRRIVRFPLTKK